MPCRRLLLVEDDEELRRMFRTALTLAGFEVREARGGFEALQIIDAERPDVIVLDLLLPGLDGYAVRRELEAHAHLRSIPVVVVTGNPPKTPSQLNANGLPVKPVSPARLVETVERCLASGASAGV
jgi:CheY-like chemotaxis protein